MTRRRIADDAAGQNRLRWPAIPPLVVALWVYLGMLHIGGVWIFVTTRFPPNDAVLYPLHRELMLGWTALEWIIFCNFAWMILFAFECLFATNLMPPTAGRHRRVFAILALVGLTVVQFGAWGIRARADTP